MEASMLEKFAHHKFLLWEETHSSVYWNELQRASPTQWCHIGWSHETSPIGWCAEEHKLDLDRPEVVKRRIVGILGVMRIWIKSHASMEIAWFEAADVGLARINWIWCRHWIVTRGWVERSIWISKRLAIEDQRKSLSKIVDREILR